MNLLAHLLSIALLPLTIGGSARIVVRAFIPARNDKSGGIFASLPEGLIAFEVSNRLQKSDPDSWVRRKRSDLLELIKGGRHPILDKVQQPLANRVQR